MDDVAESLRLLGDVVEQMVSGGAGTVTMLSGDLLIEGADEIERLRAAGDALVRALEEDRMAAAVVLVNQWKGLRHG